MCAQSGTCAREKRDGEAANEELHPQPRKRATQHELRCGDKAHVYPVVRHELLTAELRREDLPDVLDAALSPRDRAAYGQDSGTSGLVAQRTNHWESLAAVRARSKFAEHLLARDSATLANSCYLMRRSGQPDRNHIKRL